MYDSQTPCPGKREHGRHLFTAQSGDSSSAIGSGGGDKTYGLPPRLVRYCFARALDGLAGAH